MSLTFADYLASTASGVNGRVRVAMDEWVKESSSIHKELTNLARLYSEYNFGGKTLRGCLVRLGYELSGARYKKDILDVGAAIEMFQTAILVHDDIVDLSPTRRGRPTLYRALGGDHYGVSQAICLGDIGFFLSVRLILNTAFQAENKVFAAGAFCKMVVNTGLGEMLDVHLPRVKKNKTESAVLTIHKLKTSYYTIIYPLAIGAILGGAKKNLLKAIERFGEDLGIAFQIQDDILGVFGNEKKLGKSVTSDIEEGKNTLLYTEALKRAGVAQKRTLDKYYGKGALKLSEFAAVKQVFVDTGSLDYSKEQALRYVRQSQSVIPELTKDEKLQKLLYELSDFLVLREK